MGTEVYATPPEKQSVDRSPLLCVDGLRVEFATDEGWTAAVSDATLTVLPGQSHALVGESGSGKTVTALSLMGLLPAGIARIASGRVRFDTYDMVELSEKALQRLRGNEISMIFQEPMTSLNPAYTVGEQIAETVRQHTGMSRRSARHRAIDLLDLVGIPAAERRASEYPHSFSGGMRQRVMIAIAISCGPKLLIADEPTTALDVTVQASILGLLHDLQVELNMAVLFVTHDFSVVAEFCDQVTVMYAGETVEDASTIDIFEHPRHPYTAGLLSSIPSESQLGRELVTIPGTVPRPQEMPAGCHFHTRCTHSEAGICDVGTTTLEPIGDRHLTRCTRIQRGDYILEEDR